MHPVAALHSGDEYMIADTGAFRDRLAKVTNGEVFFMTDYQKIYSFDSLYRAYRKARRGKRWKGAAAKFEVNLLEALNLLSRQLEAKTYRLSPYNTFEVFEPKRRVVMSNAYKDKVVQHALCDNVLSPALTRSFITDNYASQEGKGTHYGLDRLQEFLRRFYRKNGVDGWILKCDVSKYFYSIKHDVLKSLIRRKIADPDVWWLVEMIIDSTEGNEGIPIGNQSSQLFALSYLDGMDHFIKEKLGIKHYGRYMDDFFLIHEDKAYLQYCRAEIARVLEGLGLTLNSKTNIFPLRHGIDFLGFHTYLTESGGVVRKVRRHSKNNMKRKLKNMRPLMEAGRVTPEAVAQSFQSWRAHASHGNCYHLIRRMDRYYATLFKKEEGTCHRH
jgi:retron-type reverse transcriptase